LDACFRCGQKNHYVNKCYATIDRFGDTIERDYASDIDSDIEEIVETASKLFNTILGYWKK
jgi:hypothetical protein